jgi:chaperonin GroES
MLRLDKRLTVTAQTPKEPNLAEMFSPEDRQAIANHCWDGYETDEQSREEWRKRNQKGMDLALQIAKTKTFPWPNCSNVKFPLVTIATLQFHSRAYSALVSGPNLVKADVYGADPDGRKHAVAQAVSEHMSYQLLREDRSWEEQHDRLLINLPIVGTAFKKTYHASSAGHNKSELVLAKDLVMDYYAKSVETCARKTEIIPHTRNEMVEKMLTGLFIDCTEEKWFREPARPMPQPSQSEQDKRAGLSQPVPDSATPFTVLEQHCWLDLDDDGYEEPYIVSFEPVSRSLLRIVARWSSDADVSRQAKTGRIYKIVQEEYYTKYGFIPSPDASIYDIGFGILLGPLNEAVNSLVNILIDGGVMSTTGGGFLGKGAKIRGGNYSFAPNEWKRVDSTGEDLAKSIVPLTVREPSMVLFQLLGLLINYTDRVSGSNDVMVGENPGQNTPAETSRMLVEQGSAVFKAIFKRTYRAMKWEFEKLYVLNGVNLPPSTSYGPRGDVISRDMYLGDPGSVCPAADPDMTSEAEAKQQAIAIKQDAATTPGYDIVAVTRRYLQAWKVKDIDLIYPGPDKVPQGKDVKVVLQEMKMQQAQMELEVQNQQFMAALLEEARMNTALIVKIQAELEIAAKAEAGNDADRQINAMNTMLGMVKQKQDTTFKAIELALKKKEIDKPDPKPASGSK